MLELFNKTGTYRLSTTNVWEKPEKLFDDEELTLEQAKVMDNDVLWLEEGKVCCARLKKFSITQV